MKSYGGDDDDDRPYLPWLNTFLDVENLVDVEDAVHLSLYDASSNLENWVFRSKRKSCSLSSLSVAYVSADLGDCGLTLQYCVHM